VVQASTDTHFIILNLSPCLRAQTHSCLF
jgi:hypothetical protein